MFYVIRKDCVSFKICGWNFLLRLTFESLSYAAKQQVFYC
ncbi:hypothetical protein ROSEINA2194_03049 [Roseburia inulinivorans DSM 16841]|uniref:Uncharacterized protein n=1 Tax=Roseburia inulinivorans DSM 16841 TaxID=622312 RepID=C0FWC2_9FIRM|nr:hypothetical protein ROSEINA2194_03049 [Roseburia inulinivorans DSM 16841]